MRFYFDFANETGHLGCVITEAPTVEQAYSKITDLGLNPGGEVMIAEGAPDCVIPFMDKLLLTREEVSQAFGVPVVAFSEMSDEEYEQVKGKTQQICACCNHKTKKRRTH